MYLTISGNDSFLLLHKLNLQHNSCHYQEFPVSWGSLAVMHKPHALSPPHCPPVHADLNHSPCNHCFSSHWLPAMLCSNARICLQHPPGSLFAQDAKNDEGAPSVWAARQSWCPGLLWRRGSRHFPLHKHTEQPEQGGPAAISAASTCDTTSRHPPLSCWDRGNKLQYTVMQSFIKKRHWCLIIYLFLCIKYLFSPTKPVEKELQQLEGPGFAGCGTMKK